MPLSWNEIKSGARTFSLNWKDETRERAEAQTFWNEFFQVFGKERRRIAIYEQSVAKIGNRRGSIDIFWPGMMVAEHKSRGESLSKAREQAADYCVNLSDQEHPRFVVVSDFARFRIYDLEEDEESEFGLTDFHENVEKFGFIAGYETRKLREEDPVNVQAAELLGRLYDALKDIGYGEKELEIYMVRLLFCCFAEDTGIFTPHSMFEDFIKDRTSQDGSDLAGRLNEIFDVLNTPEDSRLKNLDTQIASFPYVNGRLFERNLKTASFDRRMRDLLIACCELDWGKVSPAVFGSIFQSVMDKEARRVLGAHYTTEANILKVIQPLFLDDLWEEFRRIEKMTTKKNSKLIEFQNRLSKLQLFDPACGCGNFLIVAYRELRQLELEVIKSLHLAESQQLSMDAVAEYVKVNVDQFHGIEIEEWPAQIARVGMWLVDHLENKKVGIAFGNTFLRIPLTKSANVVHANALTKDWKAVLPSTECDYLLGNPPFVGSKYQTAAQRAEMKKVFDGVKGAGILDYVAGWYVLAANYIQGTAIEVGFVSTNSISQGEQVGVLWGELYKRYELKINFAHGTFAWSSEARGKAAVHCVIEGFSQREREKKALYDYIDIKADPVKIKAKSINPYLIEGPETVVVKRSKPICDVPKIGIGNKPIDGGHYLFTPDEKKEFVAKEPLSEEFFKKWVGAEEFINAKERWCLWLGDCPPSALRKMPLCMERIKAVREYRAASVSAPTRKLAEKPTRFHVENMPENDYLIIPSVSSERRKYVPIGMMSKEVIASNLCLVVPGAKLYHFGVLSSAMHMAWMRYVAGRLESRYRYSVKIVYNNFPWPEAPATSAVEKAAAAVLEAREKHPDETMADLYDPDATPADLRKSHVALDKAVDKAYRKKSFKTELERVGFLFEMYGKLVN